MNSANEMNVEFDSGIIYHVDEPNARRSVGY